MIKDVVGYEGLYKVTDGGAVLGKRFNTPLKAFKTQGGYYRVKLYKNKLAKPMSVHRIVATAFIPNPQNKPQINHIDGNKANNSVGNLEWVTPSENLIHSVKTGLRDISKMTNATKKRVVQTDLQGNVIKTWESMSEASRQVGVQVSNISHCCKGRIKQAGGYKWHLDLGR